MKAEEFVIKCKTEGFEEATHCSKKLWLCTDATDYCSYGERKD